MMLLGQIPVHDLKLMLSSLWNVPVGLECPQFYLVEIVGSIEDFYVISVFLFFFFEKIEIFLFQLVLILKEPKNDFLVEIYEGQ